MGKKKQKRELVTNIYGKRDPSGLIFCWKVSSGEAIRHAGGVVRPYAGLWRGMLEAEMEIGGAHWEKTEGDRGQTASAKHQNLDPLTWQDGKKAETQN